MSSMSLHIGVPKTATSYIQAWLHRNRAALRGHGVLVPDRPMFAHRLAAEHLSGGIWDTRVDLLEIRSTPLAPAIANVTNGLKSEDAFVIVSSEYFYYADPAEVCQTFRRQFGCELNIVVYIRSQGDLVLSGHNQDVKRLGKTAPRPRPAYRPMYDWGLLLDSWAKQVGKDKVRAISFDASSRRRSLVPDFVAAACPGRSIKTSGPEFEDVVYYNESLPADLLEFKRLANAWGEFGLADVLTEVLESGYAGPRFGVSPGESENWRALYQASNAYVAGEYFSGTNVDDIFPRGENSKAGVDLEGRLPIESLARLLAFEIKRQQSHRSAVEERLRALESNLAASHMKAGEPA